MGAIRPEYDEGIALCSRECPQHDGLRCRAMGRAPGNLCEPWARQALGLLRRVGEAGCEGDLGDARDEVNRFLREGW